MSTIIDPNEVKLNGIEAPVGILGTCHSFTDTHSRQVAHSTSSNFQLETH